MNPDSVHFDGARFFNPHAPAGRSFGDVVKWWRTRRAEPWPVSLPLPAVAPLPAHVPDGRVAATFIGHSTFLLRTAGAAVITDPVFTTHAGPFGRLGPRRVRPPALAVAQLPRVDVVLVSHNHYDHLQPRSLRELEARFGPVFVTTLGNRSFLERLGLKRVMELDWWQEAPAGPVQVQCVPAQHFSARGIRDRNRTLWAGFVFRSAGRTLLFVGDSGYGPHFKEIGARVPAIDVALVPIGAYEPRWFMKPMHLDPDEAVQAHLDVGARVSVGMHFGTFRLTDEGIDAPIERLVAARAAAGVPPGAFRVPEFGETLVL